MENNETNQATSTIETNLAPQQPEAVEPAKEPKKKGKGVIFTVIIVVLILMVGAYFTKTYVIDAKNDTDKKETNNTIGDVKDTIDDAKGSIEEDNTDTETSNSTVVELTKELKTKIVNMYEDHLAFTRESFTSVTSVSGSKVASYMVFFNNETKLSDLQRSTIADKYKVDVADMGDTYLERKAVETEYTLATGKSLVTFDSNEHLKYISEYEIYIDAISSHGYMYSERETFGISSEGTFDLIFIDSVTKNTDGTYSVNASMYDAYDAYDADADALSDKYKSYISGTKTVEDFNFKDTYSKYDTVFKVEGDSWYFVSNSVK